MYTFYFPCIAILYDYYFSFTWEPFTIKLRFTETVKTTVYLKQQQKETMLFHGIPSALF